MPSGSTESCSVPPMDGAGRSFASGKATNHLFAAAAFNGSIWAIGERGTLLHSDVDGAQWRQAELQIPRLSLNAIAFGKDGFGLVVGNRGLVLRTDDGGKSWQRLKIITRSLENQQSAR